MIQFINKSQLVPKTITRATLLFSLVCFLVFHLSCGSMNSGSLIKLSSQLDISGAKKKRLAKGVIEVDFEGQFIELDRLITLNNLEKISIKNLNFKIRKPSGYFQILNCERITLENINFDGSSCTQTRYALKITNSKNISIVDSKFQNFRLEVNTFEALVINNSANTLINNCEFRKIETKKVTRGVKFSDKSNLEPSLNSKIKFCRFENISPKQDADAIYIEMLDNSKRINLTIDSNYFRNVAKRFIKINASGVSIKNNIGDNYLDIPMYSFISFFGNHIEIQKNVFTSYNGNAFYGVDAGSLNIDKQNSIIISNNDIRNLITNTNKKSAGIRFASDTHEITINSNYLKGFYNSITTSFKKKNKISDLIFKDNELNCEKGIELFGASENIKIFNNKSNISRKNILIDWSNKSMNIKIDKEH